MHNLPATSIPFVHGNCKCQEASGGKESERLSEELLLCQRCTCEIGVTHLVFLRSESSFVIFRSKYVRTFCSKGVFFVILGGMMRKKFVKKNKKNKTPAK